MDYEQQLRAYESDVAPEATIRKTITDAYKGLEPELRSIHKYETEQLPTFYDAFSGYGMGTGAADMSPQARLAAASRQAAEQSALARTSSDIFDTRRARMEDLIGQAFRQWQHGHQGAQAGYNRWWQQQQAEEDRRRWEAEMALARQRAARDQYAYVPPPGYGESTSFDVDEIMNNLNIARNLNRAQEITSRPPTSIASSGDRMAQAGDWLGGQLRKLPQSGFGGIVRNVFGT